MKALFFKEQLMDAIAILGGSVGSKSHFVTAYSQMSLVAAEGLATLATTDGEHMTCALVITCKTEGELNITLPFFLFRDLIKSYWGEAVQISVDPDNSKKIVIKSGMANEVTTTINMFIHHPFTVEPTGTEITFPAEMIQEGLSAVVDACAKGDEARPRLEGVYITFHDGRMRFVATDGFRMSIYDSPYMAEEDPPDNVLLHRESVENILKMIKRFDPKDVTAYATRQAWYFDFGEAQLEVKTILGEYPDINQMTALFDQTTKTVVCDREELLACLRTTHGVVTKHELGATNICMKDGELSISAQSAEIGMVERCMPVNEVDGEFETAMNGGFLLEALRTINDPQVLIGNSDKNAPLIVKPIETNNPSHLIMPLHIAP